MSSSIVVALGALSVAGPAMVVPAAALWLLGAAAVALSPLPSRHHPTGATATLMRLWPQRLRPTTGHKRPPALSSAASADVSEPAGMPVIGYTTFSGREGEQSEAELDRQTDLITRACDQRGLELVQVVGDPHTGRPLFGHRRETPPGLSHALGRIAIGEARGLVVPGLRRLAGSLAELGPILEWFTGHDARLVAVAQGLDTTQPAGRLAARLLIEVSQWEQHRCWDPAAEDKSPSTDLASSEAGDKPDLLSRSGGESS